MLTNLTLILVCLLLGVLLRLSGRVSEQFAPALNAYVIHVALPAMVLMQVPKITLSLSLIWPAIMPWLLLGFSVALLLGLSRLLHWSRDTTGAMLMIVPLGNTSFLGFPLVSAFWTDAGLPYAIIYDQIGSFLALTVYGISIIARYGASTDDLPRHTQRPDARYILKRILQFPPFLALLGGIALKFTGTPALMQEILQRLADTLVPVILIAVGLQWRLQLAPEVRAPLAIGLLIKLLLMPALALAILHLAGIDGLLRNVTVFEAGMSAMITAAAMAMGAGLAPRLCAAMVGYGVPLSLLSLWLWYQLLA